jgi:hypothetical protein
LLVLIESEQRPKSSPRLVADVLSIPIVFDPFAAVEVPAFQADWGMNDSSN